MRIQISSESSAYLLMFHTSKGAAFTPEIHPNVSNQTLRSYILGFGLATVGHGGCPWPAGCDNKPVPPVPPETN